MGKILKKCSMLFALLLAVGMLMPMNASAEERATVNPVAVWDRTDISLTAKKAYANPYLDVEVDAVFTHTDGTEIKLAGFWDGDNEWKVRFAPTKVGAWNYVITSNQEDDAGLHNVTGSITAIENTGSSAIDKHGFIEFSDNRRYFQHADGTPFYWLGDTNWQAPNYVSITQCNYPGCSCGNQFKHEVDNRLEKGFNVYQTYFDSGESDGGGQRATTPEPKIWVEVENAKASSDNSASDRNGYGLAAKHSVDGKQDTYWCAENGNLPQWIAYDLGLKQKFNRVVMQLHDENTQYEVVIYGSNEAAAWETPGENSNWSKVYEETLDVANNLTVPVDFTEVEYQYVKIEFVSITGGHWAAVHETKVLYYETQEEKSENLMTKERYRASSYTDDYNAPSKSLDGNKNTKWCSSGGQNEWIAYDLAAQQVFNRIDMSLVASGEFEFAIYGTNEVDVWNGNGEWTELHRCNKNVVNVNNETTLEFENTTAYQYVKIEFVKSSGWAALSEAEIYNYTSRKGNNLMSSGMTAVESSKSWDGAPASKSVDGDTTTEWCAGGASFPQWVAYDLGEQKTFNLFEILIKTNDVFDVTILGTNEASAWDSIAEETGWTEIYNGELSQEASNKFSEDRTYQYIKVRFNDAEGTNWANIIEFRLFNEEKSYGDNLLNEAYKASSANEYQNNGEIWDVRKSIDGNPNTYWCSKGGTNEWVAYDLGAKKTFNGMELLLNAAGDYGFEIYGTNDASIFKSSGEWKKVYSIDTVTVDDTRKCILSFDEAEYQYIKIIFTKAQGWAALHEIELYHYEQVPTSNMTEVLPRVGKYDLINPETFKKFDEMFDYLAEKGMVIALGYGVHESTTQAMGEDLLEIARYLTARYASYPIVWITGQEIDIDWEKPVESLPLWLRVAKIVDELDGYNHPQGAHMYPGKATDSSKTEIGNQRWHEWWVTQGGHYQIPEKDRYKSYWDTGKLFLETELNYEDVNCGGFNGYELSRIGAWKANLCGSYGFTYGATGIWANCYSTAGNTGWLGNYSFEPWYMGLDKAGSFEMTYMKNFFEYAEFNKLIPRFSDATYSDFTVEEKVVSSSDDKSTYVGYFYNEDLTTGNFFGLDASKNYTARWYNPLTGKYIDIENVSITSDGTYQIPDKPTKGDWAILVTSNNLGAYETETVYQDTVGALTENFALDVNTGGLPIFKGELQNLTVETVDGMIYSAEGVMTDTKANLVDKNYTTEWSPFAPVATQTIIMDLGSSKNISGMIVTLQKDAYLPEYRIDASNDGFSWTVLADATLRAPQSTDVDNLIKVYEELAGKYRYVKLLWLGAKDANGGATNSRNKDIAEIEIYAYDDADKSALADEIAKAEQIDLNNYKDEGQDAFKNALAAAKTVYADAAPTQEEVDTAKDALTTAMEGLKKKIFNPLRPGNQGGTGEKDKSEASDENTESGKPEYYPASSSLTTAPSTAQTGVIAKTGDSNQTAFAVAMLLFATAGVVGVYVLRKRTNQE